MQTLFNAKNIDATNEIGEDTWKLFQSIERSFGVLLGDYRDLAGISVLELSRRIDALAEYRAEGSCLLQVSFNRLRQALMKVAGVQRSSVLPSTPTNDLLPWQTRQVQWAVLQSELQLTLPELHLPSWLLLLCLIAPVSLFVCARLFFVPQLNGGIIAVGSIAMIMLALRAARLYPARIVPKSARTVGDLARAVMALNYKAFADADGSSSQRGVLPSLRLLIAMETNIDIKEIKPSTRIPSGLNMY